MSFLARKRNRRFRLLLDGGGPPFAASNPFSGSVPVIRAGMRDADTDENGISSVGAIQTSNPPDFDADGGATGTASSKAVTLNASAFATALNVSGSIRFEVPRAFFDAYPAATEYFISKTGGWSEWRSSGSGYTRGRFPEDDNIVDIFTDPSTRDGILTADYLEVRFAWDANDTYYVLDHLPFSAARTVTDAASSMNTIYLGGLTGSAGSGEGIRLKDVVVSTGGPVYTANPDYGKIVFFGDSFLVQGALSSGQVGAADIFWNPGYGFANGGGASSGGSYTSDTGLIAAFFRECFRGGLIPASNCHNDAESGDSVAACKVRVSTWTASNTLQTAVIVLGANDTADLSAFSASRKATLIADYKEIIDDLVAAGANRILISNTPSGRNNPTNQTANHDANVAFFNDVLVPTIEGYNGRVVSSDIFTPLGGNSPNSSYFQSGDIHPDADGQHLVGRQLGLDLIASLT